jgi:hypothetical protein
MHILKVPEIGSKYIYRSHANDPFTRQDYIVTVVGVEKGWVQLCSRFDTLISDSLFDFHMCYKRI